MGDSGKISAALRERHVFDESKFDSIAAMSRRLDFCSIFAVTTTSAVCHPILTSNRLVFDLAVIDEGGQLTEPQVLGALRKASKFVLVGDDEQLSPLVASKEAEQCGLSLSLFERLSKHWESVAVRSLTIQYRMNDDILSLSNALIYDGAMRCASESVSTQKLEFEASGKLRESTNSAPKWLRHAVDPERAVVMVNTDRLYDDETDDGDRADVDDDKTSNGIGLGANNPNGRVTCKDGEDGQWGKKQKQLRTDEACAEKNPFN